MPTQARAGRPSGFNARVPQRRPARPPQRRTSTVTRRRRQPEPSTAGKMIAAVSSMLPAAAPSKGRAKATARNNKGKGAAGVAMLAGAAGLALKNRDKLMSMLPGKGGPERRDEAADNLTVVPVTPDAVTGPQGDGAPTTTDDQVTPPPPPGA